MRRLIRGFWQGKVVYLGILVEVGAKHATLVTNGDAGYFFQVQLPDGKQVIFV